LDQHVLWFMYACGAGAGLMIISKLAKIASAQAGLELAFVLVAVLAGKVYDATVSFYFAYYCSAALLAVAAIITLFVKPPHHMEYPMIRRPWFTFGCFSFSLIMTLVVSLIAAEEDQGQAEPEDRANRSPAKTDFGWRQTKTSLALLNRGWLVWEHVHDKKIGKPYMRFGLIDGTELTRPWPFSKDYPKSDHTWHRALWWSFKAINGVNYWEKNQRGTEPIEVEIAHNDDGSARIRTTIAYHLPDEAPVMIERRTINVAAPDATGTYLIDWQATFTPTGKDDVVFNRNSYGGLALRMAAECCGDVKTGKPAWKFLDSE